MSVRWSSRMHWILEITSESQNILNRMPFMLSLDVRDQLLAQEPPHQNPCRTKVCTSGTMQMTSTIPPFAEPAEKPSGLPIHHCLTEA